MTRRRRTPLGTEPPDVETPRPRPLDIAEWQLGAAPIEIDERKSIEIDVPHVIEMEADEPSGPIEPPLPFELQLRLEHVARPPDDLPDVNVRFRTPRATGVPQPDAPPDIAACAPDAAPDIVAQQFAAGTQTAAPALPSARTGAEDITATGAAIDAAAGIAIDAAIDAATDADQFAAGTQPAAPALPRARTGGGRVAATEPAKVASGTIEQTDLIPKVDADEEHAVIVQIDDAWLERLDLPAE